ncbi:MAG: type II toxin-antitoxin system RelB/DinJ family antitoxin [Patescibacteria group bacterium]
MNYAIVNLKIDPKTKREAQLVAGEFGIPLSTLLKSYIKQIIRTKRVVLDISEEPSEYMIQALKESKEDIKAGRVSPTFTNAKDAIAWLNDPKKKYANELL